MTWPQIIMAAWLILGVVGDYFTRKGTYGTAQWVGFSIGHTLNVLFVAYILHWGGFW